MNSKDIKVIKVDSEKVKPFIEAIEKKQSFKAKIKSGEIKTTAKKGAKFV